MLTVVLWNTAWRRPRSQSGAAIKAIIAAERPDLVCLTESHRDFLDGPHQLDSVDDFGLGPGGTRRKVVLWSRMPWHQVDRVSSPLMPPGRFVQGQTDTPLGPLRVIGVCVPWSMAHVASGRRDQSPWDEHRAYLEGLAEVTRQRRDGPTLLLGDFNQTVRRTRAPRDVWESLSAIFADGFTLASGSETAIDHFGIRGRFRVETLQNLDNSSGDSASLSDHVGVVLRLAGT